MIKNLQILRAIAALLVVFFHCDFLDIKIGQFGVDIFFVISGFIISFVLNKNQDYFLIKRFIRVMPMYYLFTITLVFIWLIYPDGFKNVYISGEAIIKSLCFIPYYIGDSGPILSLGWTLNFEIFFYIVVGVSVIILKRPSRALLSATIIIMAIGLIFAATDSANLFIRFYGNQVALEFTFGILIFYLIKKWQAALHTRTALWITGIMALIAFILLCYFDSNKMYTYRILVFGVPAFFVVLFFILSENRFHAGNFLHKYLYQVGNASYVVYLCHPFVIYFIIRLIKPHLRTSLFFSVVELILMLSSVILMSNLVHKKIELPIVKLLERILHKSQEMNNPG